MAFKLALSVFVIIGLIALGSSDCNFPAVYNFGDSNSDAGSRKDGPLIIDFLSQQLGLGQLSSYANGGDFSHGANFAKGGASIRPPGYSDVNLGVQISMFQQFKAHSPYQPDHYYKALYTFDIGQNDLAYGFSQGSEDGVKATIPNILDKFSGAVQTLYKEGARIFWVHNTGPYGCLPSSISNYGSKSGNLDQSGCIKPLNDVAQTFNSQLKDRLGWLKSQLSGTVFTYVDVYSAKYAMISSQGSGMFLDGVHYSTAANQWVARQIFFGSYSVPSVSITQSCQKG